MNRTVYVDGARVVLAPAALVGQGGEAEIYDLGDGRVVKWWKPPEHPDFTGDAGAQAAAAKRIAEAPARLRALPGNLPAAVVAPCGLALSRRKDVVGYVMPKVGGEPMHALGEPRWRREHPDVDVGAILLALHDAIAGLHRRGVVIGDCNDLNILVEHGSGRDRVHLIDVDSYQLPGFPCAMFSERFVDPRLCSPAQLGAGPPARRGKRLVGSPGLPARARPGRTCSCRPMPASCASRSAAVGSSRPACSPRPRRSSARPIDSSSLDGGLDVCRARDVIRMQPRLRRPRARRHHPRGAPVPRVRAHRAVERRGQGRQPADRELLGAAPRGAVALRRRRARAAQHPVRADAARRRRRRDRGPGREPLREEHDRRPARRDRRAAIPRSRRRSICSPTACRR